MTTDTTTIHRVIRENAARLATVFGRGDAVGVAAFYTEGGMLLPAGSESVQGRRAIAAFWKGAMDMGIKTIRIDAFEVEQHGDTAIELGEYTMSDATGRQLDHGKGLVIWKREADAWKIHRDIWTSSEAPQ